jgi:AbrB family looped-hinge helix DNA binding protein
MVDYGQLRNVDMTLVKVRGAAQITLPAEVRRKLKVKEGDYLEAEVVGSSVVLKPVTVLDRDAVWQKLMEIVKRPKWRGPGPEPSEDEVMEMVVEEIHMMRREDEKGGSR